VVSDVHDTMTYALVKDGEIKQEGYPRYWFDGVRFWDFRDEPPDPSTGWLPVVETPQPGNTEFVTHARTLELIDGSPTEVWVEFAKSPIELEQQIRDANAHLLREELQQQIMALILAVNDLNAITDTTNAAINQNPAQAIKILARVCKTIARQTARIARIVTDDTLSTDTGL